MKRLSSASILLLTLSCDPQIRQPNLYIQPQGAQGQALEGQITIHQVDDNGHETLVRTITCNPREEYEESKTYHEEGVYIEAYPEDFEHEEQYEAFEEYAETELDPEDYQQETDSEPYNPYNLITYPVTLKPGKYKITLCDKVGLSVPYLLNIAQYKPASTHSVHISLNQSKQNHYIGTNHPQER